MHSSTKYFRDNVGRRNLIRQIRTESQKAMSKLKIEFFFVFGKSKNSAPNDNSKLFDEEMKKHDDIVIGDFVDSYNNLTLKTWTGHRFLNSDYFKSCKNINWVIFHDDDAFVDYVQVSPFRVKKIFLTKDRNLYHKSKCVPKIEICTKNRTFWPKIELQKDDALRKALP